MITVRKSNERGTADYGWLDTKHTFSFNTYHDPKFMGFSDLRVINEDIVAPSKGFGTHGHRDMEILTYVVSGVLEHKDSTGGHGVIRPHEWQYMAAGSGVRHSEANASDSEPVHFLQIWILPERADLTPGYEQKEFAPASKTGTLKLIASRDGRDESIKVNQNISLYNAILPADAVVTSDLANGRKAWVQIVKGAVEINNVKLAAGDGAAISDETNLAVKAAEDSEIILFDLA